jgi:hypothetical protein
MPRDRYCKIIDDRVKFFEICECGKEYELKTTYEDVEINGMMDSGYGICECGSEIHVDGIFRTRLK